MSFKNSRMMNLCPQKHSLQKGTIIFTREGRNSGGLHVDFVEVFLTFSFGFKRREVEGGSGSKFFIKNKCFSYGTKQFYIKYNIDIFVSSICLTHIELEKMKMIP